MDIDAAPPPPPPPAWLPALSTELLPEHEGVAFAVIALSDDLLVTGGDDAQVFVWRRAGPGAAFTAVAQAADAGRRVQALLPVAPCAGLPTGGFASASLDHAVRLYSLEADASGVRVALVRTLLGHTMGVISLAMTPRGELVSGGWDGCARVWDVATGACTHVLGGHENGTCVLALPNGDIVAGSTGRKSEDNRHVDFKLRRWARAADGGFSIVQTLEDHEQAVRGLALLPDGAGWVSVGNDGAVKVRALEGGGVLSTFVNPLNDDPDGAKHYFAFSVAVARSLGGDSVGGPFLLVANEPDVVRVIDLATGAIGDIRHPGQPWCVAALPCGDIVTSGGHAGGPRRGHVLVWSTRADRAAAPESDVRAKFDADSAPPAKGDGGAAAGGTGGPSGAYPGLPAGMSISGPYEARVGFPGSADGAYGFFTLEQGGVMVCSWSAASAAWVDIGTLSDGGGGSGGGSAPAASSSSSSAAARRPGGQQWDYALPVTMDTATGVKSLELCFNRGDDPNTVAANFLAGNGIGMGEFEQVRNFILGAKAKRGDVAGSGAPAAAPAPTRAHAYFPSTAFLTHDSVDWKKVTPKLAEFNGALASAGSAHALTPAELDSVLALVAVLGETSRWHASSVPLPAVRSLCAKLLQWPPAQVFPCLDVLRVTLCHPDGAAAVAEVLGGALVTGETARIACLKDRQDKEARAAVLLSARCLFNAWRQGPTRALLAAGAPAVMDCVSDLLHHEAATVRFAGAVLLHNTAHALAGQATAAKAAAAAAASPAGPWGAAAASGSGAGAPAGPAPAHVEQLLALLVEGVQALRPPPPAAAAAAAAASGGGGAGAAGEDEPAMLKLLVALGTLVLCVGPTAAKIARAMELEDALGELPARSFPGSAPIREAVRELLPLLRAP